jgi:two-component system, LuxR family, response regulator FixJ
LKKLGGSTSNLEIAEVTDAKPRTIAIVDDDHAVRDSLRFLLQVVGHTVEVFASAAEFLGAEKRDLACLILDHHMAHMTGLELVEQLRADGINIPTLLITGAPSSTLAARAEKLGVARILEKPPNEDALMNFVDESLY